MNKKRTDHFIHAFPKYLLGFTILFLLTLYTISWLVDFKQVYIQGITEWKDQFPAPLFWLQVFREAGIVENLQWLFLGFSFLICSMITILDKKQIGKFHLGFLFLAIGLVVMLLEDSINIRHHLSYYLSIHFYDGHVGTYEWLKSGFRSRVEFSFYLFLGSIMITSYFLIFRLGINKKSFLILTIGFIVYGIAGFSSATRNIGSWYEIVGIRILNRLTEGLELFWAAESVIFYQSPLGFFFMDYVVEESFELMGATLILCSLVLVVLEKDLINES